VRLITEIVFNDRGGGDGASRGDKERQTATMSLILLRNTKPRINGGTVAAARTEAGDVV
jgi:hypothetical protein